MGPDRGFPPSTKKEKVPFEEALLAGFKSFISQREIGRPFPREITKGQHESESFSLIAQAILKLDISSTDIETFSKAIDYFTEINQGIGFGNLNIRGPAEFATLRKRMIVFLNQKTPTNRRDLDFFVSVFTLLRLKEPLSLITLWRNRKENVYDEISYIKSLEVPKAVVYVRKRLTEIK